VGTALELEVFATEEVSRSSRDVVEVSVTGGADPALTTVAGAAMLVALEG
jgi:hypothetical protein